MLLWHVIREHRLEKCCRGTCFVDTGWRNVAVARISWTSVREMLLWLRFREHWLEKCCCGTCFVDIGWRNVAVAKVS